MGLTKPLPCGVLYYLPPDSVRIELNSNIWGQKCCQCGSRMRVKEKRGRKDRGFLKEREIFSKGHSSNHLSNKSKVLRVN